MSQASLMLNPINGRFIAPKEFASRMYAMERSLAELAAIRIRQMQAKAKAKDARG